MAWTTYTNQNHEMVDKFTRLGIITSKDVENAFRCVSRAAFVSKELLNEAFIDAPIRGSPHIHMSAPHMYASILEDLELEAGMSFLNIGSGTGYFSCLTGFMLKQHGINHGIELHKDLVDFSQERTNDFFSNGPADVKDICPPLFVAGNCFRLDPRQMKYDRLYCGGACSQSTITFFLEFLKVGGFLIAPVGTKLVKLERVSYKEGIKTVISDVCFAPLTRLDPADVVKLKHGLLPLIRFPIKTKKRNPKKTIFANVNFPISSSPARKKISRLRAIQHILNSLEEDSSIPLPLCYVPQLDQINAYKQYKKAVDCQEPIKNPSSVSESETNVNNVPQTGQEQQLGGNFISSMPATALSPLMTIQEFLLTSSPPTIFNEFFATSTRSESVTGNESREMETFLGTRLSSRRGSRDSQLRGRLNESLLNVIAQNRRTVTPTRNVTVMERTNSVDFEIDDKVSKDIWEHLCTDKLWETVVDYYYSVCSTDSERKKQCFELKGIELANPTASKLADVLLFKMHKKSKTSINLLRDSDIKKALARICFTSEDTVALEKSSLPVVVDKSSFLNKEGTVTHSNSEENIVADVKFTLNTVLDCVSHIVEGNERSSDLIPDISNDSLDSILTIPSLNNTEDSSSNSFENLDTERTSCSTPLKNKHFKSKYVDIQTDNATSKCLSRVKQHGWTIDHDVELISFLVSQGKESEVFSLRNNVTKIINEKVFEKNKLTKYPLLSSFSPLLLSYRGIALVRIAKLLDSVLDILVGPSFDRNQFNNPFQENYPLSSFTCSSFDGSNSQLNVLEALNKKIAKPVKVAEDIHQDVVYQEATTEQDEELLKEVDSMISYEMSNVKQQQAILQRKLELIDNINEQYKEQIKLLNQQISLIEEQQRLLYEVNVDAGYNSLLRTQLTSSQHMVADRKVQRQSLISKRDKINTDRTVQQAERKELLNMLEQLLSLETRLNSEQTSLGRKGMGYLRDQESGLSNFSQFVRKAQKILTRLKTSNTRMNQIVEAKKEDEVVKKKIHTENKPSLRYDPETILPRCRFLLPLSKKRHSFIKEMLRTTERSAPHSMPVISVDRRIPVNERHKHGLESTVFMQIYQSLRNKDLHFRWNKKSYDQWWEVKFSGEGIIDQGGGFRDSLTEMSEELCPSDTTAEIAVPLFIKTANQQSGIGEYLDCYTVNPNCDKFHLYRWLGQLLGACFRSDETIPFSLPPIIWKLLVGEHVSWKKDFAQIDEVAVQNVDGLENLDEDAYIGLNIEEFYTTTLTDGSSIELVDNGSNKIVQCYERSNYSRLIRQARMMESVKQIKAIRDGLLTVLPEAVLSCLTWKNLERGVCGNPCITVADLKANCRYSDNLKSNSQCVLHMWAALASFTDDERSRFIRFITGRRRLPSPFIVSRSSSEKDDLPSASTCGSNLFLPEYSSVQVTKEKIRYAIYNCIAIDTDTSPW